MASLENAQCHRRPRTLPEHTGYVATIPPQEHSRQEGEDQPQHDSQLDCRAKMATFFYTQPSMSNPPASTSATHPTLLPVR